MFVGQAVAGSLARLCHSIICRVHDALAGVNQACAQLQSCTFLCVVGWLMCVVLLHSVTAASAGALFMPALPPLQQPVVCGPFEHVHVNS